MTRPRVLPLLLLVAASMVWSSGCASSSPRRERPEIEDDRLLGEGPGVDPSAVAAPVEDRPAAPRAACDAFARPGALKRPAVVRAVDAGLGKWLQGVEVTPQRRNGRFQGWIVRRLYPGDPCYAAVDVMPGDVVTRVNGRSVERFDQAYEIFGSLRTAPALVVELTRNGAPRVLTFPIAEE